ncbi:MAG: hypothetical protein IJX78_03035 [Bacilli bacterium]|nr:hypothetical protein [Bacilli bacterium]
MQKNIVNKTPRIKKTKNASIKKLKLLITIVNRSKALYFSDLLEQFEINMQTIVYGHGTANSEMLSYLGLAESDKAVIVSCIREDQVKKAQEILSEKFEKIKEGKGVAFTIPLKSIIGVSIYQFLSNNRTMKKEDKNNE